MLGLHLYCISRTYPTSNKALIYIYGDHSMICGTGSERTNRRNYVRDTQYHILNLAGLSTPLETSNFTPGTIRRPRDVSVNNLSLGVLLNLDLYQPPSMYQSPIRYRTLLF